MSLTQQQLGYAERIANMVSKVCDGNNGMFECVKVLYNGSGRCVNCQMKIPVDLR